MLSNGYSEYEYDSANRLIKADGHTYTYNAEDVRIRNLCSDADTTYTYNTNCRLSQLLCKTTNGITTKYVYGHGLIGEEKCGKFKTYHFDYRGSTVAITNINGDITDTFKYDTYGKLISRTGSSFVIFGYNGRDGVITDKNGLYYMRARYYSPEMRRFINADILHGEISDSTSLNRYAYVNGNPVSYVDPFGLSADEDKNTANIDFLLSILNEYKDQENNEVASSLLAAFLDQILNYKNIFAITGEGAIPIVLGNNMSGVISVSASIGNGNLEISSVVSEQFELLGSISFDFSNLTFSRNTNGGISISYSADVDEYNTVFASISGIPGVSISAGYTISTTDKNNNFVSTSIELIYNNNNLPPVGSVPAYSHKNESSESYDWYWLRAVAGVIVLGIAFGTDAFGIAVDDPILIPIGGALLGSGG